MTPRSNNPSQSDQLSYRIWQGVPREDLVTRVANALREQVQAGTLAKGSQLPGEMELARQLGISRPTLREATRILAREGLLVIRHGVGTFVSDNSTHVSSPLDTMRSMSTLIRDFGGEPRIKDLKIRRIVADVEIAAALGIQKGDPVAEISRIRMFGNRPLAYAREYLSLLNPERDFSVVKTFDGVSIYQFVTQKMKQTLSYSETSVTAVSATKAQSALLALKTRAPLLLMKERHFDSQGRPVLYSVNMHNSEVVEFTLVRLGAKS